MQGSCGAALQRAVSGKASCPAWLSMWGSVLTSSVRTLGGLGDPPVQGRAQCLVRVGANRAPCLVPLTLGTFSGVG